MKKLPKSLLGDNKSERLVMMLCGAYALHKLAPGERQKVLARAAQIFVSLSVRDREVLTATCFEAHGERPLEKISERLKLSPALITRSLQASMAVFRGKLGKEFPVLVPPARRSATA